MYSDELRIMHEMQTFSVADLANALQMTQQGAHQILEQLMRQRCVERVRVGHAHLYALTGRGYSRVQKMPEIDPDERCLLLVCVPVTRYLYHNDTPVIDTSEDDIGIVGI